MASLFPSSMICTIDRPLDEKSNVLNITERDNIPISQRFRGMVVVIQNTGAIRPQIFWLPTDNKNLWEEIEINANSSVSVEDWAYGSDYIQNQLVANNGVLYRCKTAHISSALFTTDASNWEKIGGTGNYQHIQVLPSATWLIQHNFGYIPSSLLCVDSSGEEIVGYRDMPASTVNLLVVRFSEELDGVAYISG